MSSTNRSNARDTHISDYYVTPPQAIADFLEAFRNDYAELFSLRPDIIPPKESNLIILDPCAGGDASHPMSYPLALTNSKWGCRQIDTIDIREDSLAECKQDYLKTRCEWPYDVIITNPPFNIALDIINKAFQDVKEGGLVIMLLRLNFFGSQKRKTFWREHMPVAVYVHSERMKFTNTAGTDSIEYMHAVWQRGNNPRFTKLRII